MPIKGNRTRLIATLIMILGVIETYVREIISPEYQGLVLVAIGITMIILRQVTTTPPGKPTPKEPDPDEYEQTGI